MAMTILSILIPTTTEIIIVIILHSIIDFIVVIVDDSILVVHRKCCKGKQETLETLEQETCGKLRGQTGNFGGDDSDGQT